MNLYFFMPKWLKTKQNCLILLVFSMGFMQFQLIFSCKNLENLNFVSDAKVFLLTLSFFLTLSLKFVGVRRSSSELNIKLLNHRFCVFRRIFHVFS